MKILSELKIIKKKYFNRSLIKFNINFIKYNLGIYILLLFHTPNGCNHWIRRYEWIYNKRKVKINFYFKKKKLTHDKIRIFSVLWMYFGCFIYSYIIGSLSSLLSALDDKYLVYQESLNTFLEIKKDYQIDNILSSKINSALKYDIKSFLNTFMYY